MPTTTTLGALASATATLLIGALAAQEPAHDAAFWRRLLQPTTQTPAPAELPGLVRELVGLLGSSDPELRDELAYALLVRWVYSERAAPPELLRELLQSLRANLARDVGAVGDAGGGDTGVLRRSFSALALGVLQALDNDAPYLEPAEFAALLDSALAYLAAERDVRGFDATLGWIHSVAHTADLLKLLGRSRLLTVPMQARILAAIAAKLDAVPTALAHGEDERLARAVLALCARDDFDRQEFAAWLGRLTPPLPAAPTDIDLARHFNRRHVLVSLYAVLMADRRASESLAAARGAVLAALR